MEGESTMKVGLLAALLIGAASLTTSALAGPLICPPPTDVRCVPAKLTLGPWQHNGGQMTGNTFAPNNQCANVINLGPNKFRLLCCYAKCGVFIQDVSASVCRKVSEREFDCR
jgi:hypothetical protein